MSLARPYRPRDGHFRGDGRLSYGRNGSMGKRAIDAASNYNWNYDVGPYNSNFCIRNYGSSCGYSEKLMLDGPNYDPGWHDVMPSSKRRKVSDLPCESNGRSYQQRITYENGFENVAGPWRHVPSQFFTAYCNAPLVYDNSSVVVTATRSDDASAYAPTTSKRDRSKFEDDEEGVFMSRDEIERCSPSRKDGIDVLQETHLRYSYCAFLQNLGVQLDLPQTTIGTAMVLCHRFFVRRSHACHDRFLIATAALFLASKSEETARPLNDVLRASCEVLHKQEYTVLSYMFPIDWFEQYREKIIDAEQLILTTLNFEISVQHPYESLTSTLQKLGFSQSILVNLALSLVSEGYILHIHVDEKYNWHSLGKIYFKSKHGDLHVASLSRRLGLAQRGLACYTHLNRHGVGILWQQRLRSSLWLQFKPHQIAAGAAYLAAKFLNMNLASSHNVWKEFHTPPSVLRVVAHQLMELF